LDLAPGGHLGRFIIYTKDAFQSLDTQFGTFKTSSNVKHGFRLPRPSMSNSDLGRIINSEEVQSQLRSKHVRCRTGRKKNPFKNFQFMLKLNPYAKTLKRSRLVSAMRAQKAKAAATEAKRKGVKAKKTKKPRAPKSFVSRLLALILYW